MQSRREPHQCDKSTFTNNPTAGVISNGEILKEFP